MIWRVLLALLALCLGPALALADAVRIKDLVEFDGVRGNDLVGYGLVVGLNGTGDGIRNAPFTEEIMANLLERLGVNVAGEEFRPKNVAAVFVTAQLPAFARSISSSATLSNRAIMVGVAVASITRRHHDHALALVEGQVVPTLNGQPVGQDPVLLKDGDVIELAGTQMQFIHP